jgi:hypothetical protein
MNDKELKKSKLLKYKFILFLKQFKINEVKILMQFIELLLKEYHENSNKLFKLLRPDEKIDNEDEQEEDKVEKKEEGEGEEEVEEDDQKEVSKKADDNDENDELNGDNLPRIVKVESLSSLIQSPPSSQASSGEEIAKTFLKVTSKRLPSGFIAPKSKQHEQNELLSGEELDEDEEEEDYYEEEYIDDDDDDDENEEDDETFDELNEEEEEDDADHNMDYSDDDYDVQRERNQRVRKFSDSIREELEKEFKKSKYVSGQEKIDLAKRLHLTVRQVQKWFVHRREKYRKLEKLKQQQNNSTISQQNKDDSIDNKSLDDEQDIVVKQPQRRSAFTPEVTKCLEKIFAKRKYLQPNEIQELAQAVDLTPKQIKSWFKNRRQRTKGDYTLLRRNGDESGTSSSFGAYPKEVLDELERAFAKDKYICGFDKKNLAQRLNLKPIQIERWFYYRRKKANVSSNE